MSFLQGFQNAVAPAQYVNNEFQRMNEQRRADALRNAQGDAYGAIDPQLGDIARSGGDPRGLMQAQDAQLQQMLKRTGNIAAMIARAPDENSRRMIYRSARSSLAPMEKYLGLPLPQDWSEDLLDEVQNISQVLSGGGQASDSGSWSNAGGGVLFNTKTGAQQQLTGYQSGKAGASSAYSSEEEILNAAGLKAQELSAQGMTDEQIGEQLNPWIAQQYQALQAKPAAKPSAWDQRVAAAKAAGASDEEVRRMILGGRQGAGSKPGSGPDAKAEGTLRREYQALIKEPLVVVNAYNKVKGAAATPSAAGDLSMIFAFMKMLDPGSVVREQEFANAQNAAGVPDQVRNLYNRVLSGQRLNPAQRQDFLGQAEALAQQSQSVIADYQERYSGLATEYGFDPGRIVHSPFDKPEKKPGKTAASADNFAGFRVLD